MAIALSIKAPVHQVGLGLVPLLGNKGLNAATAQVLACGTAGIASVAHNRLRPVSWPSTALALYETAFEQARGTTYPSRC